jgi:hypothetical protein
VGGSRARRAPFWAVLATVKHHVPHVPEYIALRLISIPAPASASFISRSGAWVEGGEGKGKGKCKASYLAFP